MAAALEGLVSGGVFMVPLLLHFLMHWGEVWLVAHHPTVLCGWCRSHVMEHSDSSYWHSCAVVHAPQAMVHSSSIFFRHLVGRHK